jgi:hypothetical protein
MKKNSKVAPNPKLSKPFYFLFAFSTPPFWKEKNMGMLGIIITYFNSSPLGWNIPY